MRWLSARSAPCCNVAGDRSALAVYGTRHRRLRLRHARGSGAPSDKGREGYKAEYSRASGPGKVEYASVDLNAS